MLAILPTLGNILLISTFERILPKTADTKEAGNRTHFNVLLTSAITLAQTIVDQINPGLVLFLESLFYY